MEAYDPASAPPPNSAKERSSSYLSQASYHAPPSHALTSSSNLLAEPLLLRASSSSHSLSESQSASHYSHPASISRSSSSGPLSEGARRKAEEAGILSVPGRPPAATTYHTDSGVRFAALNADAVDPAESHAEGSGSGVGAVPADVPPSYTAS